MILTAEHSYLNSKENESSVPVLPTVYRPQYYWNILSIEFSPSQVNLTCVKLAKATRHLGLVKVKDILSSWDGLFFKIPKILYSDRMKTPIPAVTIYDGLCEYRDQFKPFLQEVHPLVSWC